MKESPGKFHLCPTLKSFFTEKVGGLLSHCNSSNKYKKLDAKLEGKMIEVIKHKGSSEKKTFKSMNSIIMRFPQFKEEMRLIKDVFEQYDEDSNGSIDRDELRKCLGKLQVQLTEKEMEDLFQSCDIDKNEGIQFNEFIVLLCLVYLLMEPSSSSNTKSQMGSPQLEAVFDTIIQAFLFLDKNGDGKLNKKDLAKAFNEAPTQEKLPRHITKSRFKEMDWNRSGKVSFKDFLFALTKWVGIDTDDEKD
ncbi:PREDICTED: probable calcium-binding protein CML22 [Nelumbo nucifera]|uniref:Probable calcium-binding protein CML22 n=1 Tax=Nelumbo nucifera TaxID=4432 RepID=A0A1U7YQZ4_NELNU|nr:PREDICTED: probable calcium-binding protein CML22 [Nelumbo nucifera]